MREPTGGIQHPPCSSDRNSVLLSLPLRITLCSLGLCLAFACGEQPTGLTLNSVPHWGTAQLRSTHFVRSVRFAGELSFAIGRLLGNSSCSPRFRLAFACGECPTGAPLGSAPPRCTIVSGIGSGLPAGIRKRAPRGGSFSYGSSRARTYDLHDVKEGQRKSNYEVDNECPLIRLSILVYSLLALL